MGVFSPLFPSMLPPKKFAIGPDIANNWSVPFGGL